MTFLLYSSRESSTLRHLLLTISAIGALALSASAFSASRIATLRGLDMSDGLVVFDQGAYQMGPKLRQELQQEQSNGTLRLRSGMRVRVETVPIPGAPGSGPRSEMAVKLIPLGGGRQ